MDQVKRKAGQPTLYTPELAKEICAAISCTSMGLRRLCEKNTHFPHIDTIYEWLSKHKEFSELYVNAKRQQSFVLADEIIDIADQTEKDRLGNGKQNTEFIMRSTLRINTRKWMAAKLMPRLFGDKLMVEHKHSELSTQGTGTLDPNESAQIYAEIIKK